MHKPFSVHSLAPDLVDPKGHLYHYHLALKAAVEQLELKHIAWVSRDCKIAPLPLGWKSFFSRRFSLRWREYRQLFSSPEERCRLFFIDTFNLYHLTLLLTVFCMWAHSQDTLALFLRYPPQQLRFQGKLHRFFFKIFKRRLLLLTDSRLIMQAWRSSEPLFLLPIPHTQAASPFQTRALAQPICCWWPGEPRISKGRETIAKLLCLNDPHFLLYVSEEAAFEKTPMLKEVSATLSQEEYFSYFQRCPVILLPYDPDVYHSSTSGIFVEAICAGCLPLVKKGTWMAEELKLFSLEECIVDWENPLFFKDLQALLLNHPLLEKLQKMQEHYLQFHSVSSLSKYLHQLVTHLQKG